jgi:hypothetical protein
MHLRKLLDWKTLLIYLYLWMGIVLGLVFVVWFISGVAMMYVGMPRLSVAERLGHLPPLNLSIARVSPAEAAERHQLLGRQLKIEMYFDGRPIYRIDGTTKVYADTGDLVPEAIALVQRWVPQLRVDGELRRQRTEMFSGAMSLGVPFTSLHHAPPTDAQRTAVGRSPLASI